MLGKGVSDINSLQKSEKLFKTKLGRKLSTPTLILKNERAVTHVSAAGILVINEL